MDCTGFSLFGGPDLDQSGPPHLGRGMTHSLKQPRHASVSPAARPAVATAASAQAANHTATQSADDDVRLTIGELAAELGLTTRTIRFYEQKGLIAPLRKGVARYYGRRDRARMTLILQGKNLGFSLEDIAEFLALYDSDPSQVAQAKMLRAKVDAAIAELETKRADIERALSDLKDISRRCSEHLSAGPNSG
jgi:DNA-binding transcriptional MerR regulator